jgi:hypothetical protein
VQYVVDPHFASVATPPTTQIRLLDRAIELLVKRAENQNRVLIGWSSHECAIVREYCPLLADRFEAVYCDGRQTAKRWRRIVRPDLHIERDERKRKHRLDVYAAVFGFSRPEDLGVKDVGMALGRLRSALESTDFRQLSARRKREWELILKHNEFDCRAARHVCLSAIEAIDERASA